MPALPSLAAWNLQSLRPSQLRLEPAQFCWSTPPKQSSLATSLRRYGVLTPLLVQMTGSEYRLIDGYQRHGHLEPETAVPCLVLPEATPTADLLRLRLETLGFRPLTGIEQCQIVKRLQAGGLDREELVQQVLPRLGERASPRRCTEMLQLAECFGSTEFPDVLREASLEDWLPLLRFSSNDVPRLLEVGRQLNCGGRKWRALLQVLDELRRIEETEATKILARPEIEAILQSAHLQAPVRYRQCKQQLDAWRFPTLAQMRADFEECCKQLHLPRSVELRPDPFLERDELEIGLRVRSIPQLQQAAQALQPDASAAVWAQIFAIVHGEI